MSIAALRQVEISAYFLCGMLYTDIVERPDRESDRRGYGNK